MRRWSSGVIPSAIATSGVLLAMLAALRLGAPVPPGVITISVAVAVPVATAAALQRLAYLWRGPSIIPFSRADAVRCGVSDAEEIRAAAQVRGTLGGAGHVYRARLALHALACAASATLGVFALLGVPDAGGGWPLSLAAATGLGAVLLPARPFYYLEAKNGEVVVSPASTRGLVVWTRSGRPRTSRRPAVVGPTASGGADGSPTPTPASEPADMLQHDP